MDEDRDKVISKQVAGSAKDVVGNREIEDEGARETAGGADLRDLGVSTGPDPDKPE